MPLLDGGNNRHPGHRSYTPSRTLTAPLAREVVNGPSAGLDPTRDLASRRWPGFGVFRPSSVASRGQTCHHKMCGLYDLG